MTMNGPHTARAHYVTPQILSASFTGPTSVTAGSTNTYTASYTISSGGAPLSNVKVQGGITSKATSLVVTCDGTTTVYTGPLATFKGAACGGTLSINTSKQNNVFTWTFTSMGPSESHTLTIQFNFMPTSPGTYTITGPWSAVCTSTIGDVPITNNTPYIHTVTERRRILKHSDVTLVSNPQIAGRVECNTLRKV